MTSETLSSKFELWHDLSGKVVMGHRSLVWSWARILFRPGKAGCKIVATARRIDRLMSLCDEVRRLGCTADVQAVALKLDITAKGHIIEDSVKKAWEAFGRIDASINNAGVRGTIHSPLQLSEEEWDNTMRTNLTGPWLVSKYVCKLMCDANQGGSIINIASIIGGNRGETPGSLAYACSKAGIVPLTKIMAMELGTCNIRVNSIHPGLFKSEITKGLLEEEWVKNVAKKGTPMRTFGAVDLALTKLARYLIHDSSKYI